MILSVSPNLGIDVTIQLDRLQPGEVHRVKTTKRQAGGKGVNVARALTRLDERVCVLGFAGGDELSRRFAEEGIDARLVAVESEPRTCTIYLTPDGAATVVNEAGAPVEREDKLWEQYRALVPRADAVALMGSLPPGVSSELYEKMARLARSQGVFCVVDTSGEPLVRALRARPSVVAPNSSEAEALLGQTLESNDARRDAVAALRERGAELAIVTLGREGLVVAGPEGFSGSLHRRSPVDMRFGNPIGAGDALVAGLLAARLRGFATVEMLRFAMACAVASLAEGYGRFRPRDLRPEEIVFDATD